MKKSRFVSLLPIKAGPTPWDAQGRFAGETDLSLTPDAAARISALGATFRGKLAAICTGPEQSCIEGGVLFAGSTKPKPRKLESLRDPGIGLWQGMLESELERRYPACFESWKVDPASVSIPSGEEWLHASGRFICELLELSGRLADGEARHLALIVRPLAWAELVRIASKRATADIPAILDSDDERPMLVDIDRLRDHAEAAGLKAGSLISRPFLRLLGT